MDTQKRTPFSAASLGAMHRETVHSPPESVSPLGSRRVTTKEFVYMSVKMRISSVGTDTVLLPQVSTP